MNIDGNGPPERRPTQVPFDCAVSPGFCDWLRQSGGSVIVSTYQAGKLALFSAVGNQLSVLLRDFSKPMGFAIHGDRFALATRHEITIFANAPLLAENYLEDEPGRYDSLFLPRVTFHTGDLNTHDVAFGQDGLWLTNTRFSCLAGVSHDSCFIPRWKPPFVSDFAPEDRCHLNGLALVDGQPRYVTCLGRTDTPGGWREQKATSGVILDVPSGDVVLDRLSMPHSPRYFREALWFLNSGRGELCRLSPGKAQADVICRLPGYLRGLCVMEKFALVGLCQIRESSVFGGLPIQQQETPLVAGIALVDLQHGKEVGRIEFLSGCTEVFEVQFLPDRRRPMIVNSQQEPAKQAFPCPGFSYWLRPGNLIQDHS